MERFEVATAIGAPAEEVWRRVTSPAGINAELMPVMRMTVPRAMRGRTIADVAPGSRLGRSWLLLFGFLPFEYDDIGIGELETGRRFLERSTMLSMKYWEHERTVVPDGDECQLRDRVTFDLRPPLGSVAAVPRLLRSLLRRLFDHRHARVVQHFDRYPVAPPALKDL